MSLDIKGKEILKEAQFNKFKEAFIESLMEKISMEGRYGANIRPLIEDTLKEEAFVDFINKITELIEKSKIEKDDCSKTAGVLIEEEIADDIKEILHGQLDEEEDSNTSKENQRLHSKGERLKFWKGPRLKRLLGGKHTRLGDISRLFKDHPILRYPVILGAMFLIISAALFNSVYKALVVGLTLTIFPGETLKLMVANILGGLGGILLFFTSVTIVLEYILIAERRNTHIQELAREYLKRK